MVMCQHAHASCSFRIPTSPLLAHLPDMRCTSSLTCALDFAETYIKPWSQGKEEAVQLSVIMNLEAAFMYGETMLVVLGAS
jgi:hypothetical protein